ncbi:zinc-ribbon domain-containing protein [Nitrosopumilus sp.]|uniref:zinc ribbon domain-containing protein n=1 Tax=Nitrosopumilus sp. TaxID=2024843 RepID=UPI003D13057A
MSFGEVDTLNMLFDKLQSLFDESQGYYESFLDTNNMYKKGQISDKEFFQKLGDYTVAYSALEFLAIKVIFELKKSIGSGSGSTQSPGLMPGMGQPGMMAGGAPPRTGTAQNPVGGGPPGIVSAQEAFNDVGTLPSPDPALMPRQTAPQNNGNGCSSCGAELRPNAKFCTKCGVKA